METDNLKPPKGRMLVTEVSVTVKDESCKVVEKSLVYGLVEIHQESPEICSMIEDALSKFRNHINGEGPDIIVKTKTVWQ